MLHQFHSLHTLSDQRLLQLYSDLMEELRARDTIRSSNNPVADYAEKKAVELLRLTRSGKEEKGFDAVDQYGRRYQIKARRITRHNHSRQLSVIRNLELHLFDFVVAVIFAEDFSVSEVWKIPYTYVKANCVESKHQNGHIFYARPERLSCGLGVERIF